MTKFSFPTFHTKKSALSEQCLWVKDGGRFICISYCYLPMTGLIQYASSVLKTDEVEPTEYQIEAHEHTTMRRYEIRPIQTDIGSYLGYDEMLKQIRREMCHGLGCVGIRHPVKRSDEEESLSSVEMMSDTTDDTSIIPSHTVSPRTYGLKTVHCVKYGYVEDESYGPLINDVFFTQRTIFICFKGLSQTGDILYGACIHHEGANAIDQYEDPDIDDESHYETAMLRLEKCPVQMTIPLEFRDQLKRSAVHRDDVMYLIIDKIKARVGGYLQIKGRR